MQVFVSYSRGTPYFAENIKSFLESNGLAVWLDLDDIPGGAVWEQTIIDAVEESFVVIVVVTRQALGSQWISREIEVAKQQKRSIIPLIMERMDNLDEALKKLGVAGFQYIDFVRQRKIGAEDQLLKTIERNRENWSSVIPAIQKLKSDSKVEQIFGIKQIGKAEGEAKSYLYPFLKDPDWEMRREAVEALVHAADETSVEPLIELIRVGRNCLKYSETLTGEEEFLISLTMNLATLILGWIGSLESAPFLRSQAREGDALAITSLGYLRDADSVKTLTDILDNLWRNDLVVEFACIWALGRIGTQDAAKSINGWLRKYLPIIRTEEIEYNEVVKGTYEKNAYYLWDDLAIPHHFAESFVFDNRINVVKAAIIVLGLIRNADFLDTIVEILLLTQQENDYDQPIIDVPSIHCAAAFALGLFGDEKALPVLKVLKLRYGDKPSDAEANTYYPIDFVSEAIQMIEHTTASAN